MQHHSDFQTPKRCNMKTVDSDTFNGKNRWRGRQQHRNDVDDGPINRNQISRTTTLATLSTTCQTDDNNSNYIAHSSIGDRRTRQYRGPARYKLQMSQWRRLMLAIALLALLNFHNLGVLINAHEYVSHTTPMQANYTTLDAVATTINTADVIATTDSTDEALSGKATSGTAANWPHNHTSSRRTAYIKGRGLHAGSVHDSIFMFLARKFSNGNELWDGIMKDCYQRPSFTCFQKNVYGYLSDALEARDVNVTQRLKFFRNAVDYEHYETTEAALTREESEEKTDDQLANNKIPKQTARAAGSLGDEVADTPATTPIEEVTNALYGKSIKFAMTHDIELKLPDVFLDGATFRISPRQIEGNGIIAKLELIPKQEVEARLAGKILMKKIQKFFRSKVLLSLIALVLIIKIIKIKLFWLLPLVIGVGAAKQLLLKFLLFLFPALSHLFKLCSYYQQTYHSTKYHHHHHLINHHHTIVPSWHSAEQHSSHPGPELIYTQPPKGHISAYLNGAPIHESYGPPSHDDYSGGWENSGPGLGSEYINDINRVAQVDESSNVFVPHTNDANLIQAWGLGTTQTPQQQKQRPPLTTQQQRPPIGQKPPQYIAPHSYQKPHATSNSFNPFMISDKSSTIFRQSPKGPNGAHSAPSPVYTPHRNVAPSPPATRPPQRPPTATGRQPTAASRQPVTGALTAAQIAAQYEPNRNQHYHQQQFEDQLSPEVAAQVKEALRIQAEARIVTQQQKILEHQPFVQDGQPIMPKNYDPFYSPLLEKIDKIVEQLGVKDELCKERLVCSMYKDPTRYSPHSNFVSAELSRDTNELEPVTNTNQAVLRFYRLIQAARDGQEHKDCLRLYPHCNINTE